MEYLEDLLPRLDRLVSAVEHDRENSASAIAELRGVKNKMLLAGNVQLITANFLWSIDFVVPFASVLVADLQGAGPLVISTDGTGAALGAGSLQIPVNAFACVPLVGRHLSISGAANKPVFVAVYTTAQSPAFGVL